MNLIYKTLQGIISVLYWIIQGNLVEAKEIYRIYELDKCESEIEEKIEE